MAPAVLAFNRHAMIIERCEKKLGSKDLPDGYKWKSNMSLTTRRHISTLNTALGTGIQKIKKFTRTMHEKLGMYNMDPNIDNYMLLRGKLVQIDFGMNRFDGQAAYERWASFIGKTEECKDILIDKQRPTYPPDFGLSKDFMAPYDQDENKQGWDQTKWTLYHNHLAERRVNLIKSIESGKRNSMFKTHCLVHNSQ